MTHAFNKISGKNNKKSYKSRSIKCINKSRNTPANESIAIVETQDVANQIAFASTSMGLTQRGGHRRRNERKRKNVKRTKQTNNAKQNKKISGKREERMRERDRKDKDEEEKRGRRKDSGEIKILTPRHPHTKKTERQKLN